MDFVAVIIGLGVAMIALFYQIRSYRKQKKKYPLFKGTIGEDESDRQTKKFIDFAFKNETKIIKLDINLNDQECYDDSEEGYFTFSFYYNKNQKTDGGYSIRIELSNDKDFFFDNRLTSLRMSGYFKVVGFVGPNQGWMTCLLKPVNIEDLSN